MVIKMPIVKLLQNWVNKTESFDKPELSFPVLPVLKGI